MAVRAEKTTMMPDQYVKKVRRYVHSFRHDDGIGETDGQTDRQTDGWICYSNIALCVHWHADAR